MFSALLCDRKCLVWTTVSPKGGCHDEGHSKKKVSVWWAVTTMCRLLCLCILSCKHPEMVMSSLFLPAERSDLWKTGQKSRLPNISLFKGYALFNLFFSFPPAFSLSSKLTSELYLRITKCHWSRPYGSHQKLMHSLKDSFSLYTLIGTAIHCGWLITNQCLLSTKSCMGGSEAAFHSSLSHTVAEDPYDAQRTKRAADSSHMSINPLRP